jgi:transcriptional regulator with XRE-family HTH domain
MKDEMDHSTRAVPEETDTLRLVAERLRRLRRANGLSLRQLAEATGTSASFLSQLERGLTGASTSTLIRIANCFGTSISELFSGAETTRDPVLRRAQRPALPVTDGQRKMLLSRRPLTHFETYISEFDVGGSTGPEQYTHGDSHEMFIVLQGSVRLELGSDHYEMHAGDSVEYATSVPHRVANIGEVTAEVLFIISPPTSTATYLDTYRAKGRATPASRGAGAVRPAAKEVKKTKP